MTGKECVIPSLDAPPADNNPLTNAGTLEDIVARRQQAQGHEQPQRRQGRQSQPRGPAKQGMKRDGWRSQSHSKQPARKVGFDLRDPGVHRRAEVRRRFLDDQDCSHRHSVEMGKRGHTNYNCFGQSWRQATNSGASQLPIQLAAPQPAPPPALIATPPVTFNNNGQLAFIVDPSAAREGLAMLTQAKK